ncbi:SPOC domain / Transcription elongation factor S-II protein [Zea mays]|uniref:SPOC domain / Transcription elongation factor S-II protein n=1 Tax=Zea mays TaxID=4577 RepID=A0A1D6H7H4_MAIZE|nr:SPOC domain / Transcription elongation factor S-II protein [Zea mays]
MEFSKQGQAPVPNNIGSQPLPSSNVQSNQTERPSMFYPSSLPGDWSSQQMFSMGTSVPVSSYCIVPMNQQPVQLGASRPEISRPLGPQPLLSRVSLRPPQQVLNIHTSLPGMAGSQHSPSMAGRRSQQTIGSPKVQMLKSPSFQSSNKRSAQKEPPSKVQHQQLESVRSKFRESLVAALSLDSDQQNKIQSDNVQSAGSIDNFKPGAGDAVQDLVATTSKDVCTTNSGVDTTVAPSRCEENEKLSSDLALEMTTSINDGMQQQSIQVSSEDDLLGQCMVADELLQGHGLSWVSDLDAGISELNAEPNALKRPRTSNVESESKRIKSANELAMEKEKFNQRAEILAFRIEEELFKLFGGVNKKYKEKGRSLLFNLKDKSNPELRERVLSGDIVPERLCSMTAEELASKELSEWRLAKAEEFAQMVVLPTMEVDPRRLVRKTHKGEFQVEVEEPDGFSVEVELGSNVTNIPSKAVEDQTKSNGTAGKVDVQEKDKASDSASHDEDGRTGNNGIPGDVECIDNEKADLMQELILDDVKDTVNLPPIPSLDEFMQGLDSEPPFVDISVGTPQEDVNDSDELDTTMEPSDLPETEDNASAPEKTESKSDKSSAQVNSEHRLESPGHIAVQNSDLTEPRDGELSKSSPSPDKDEAKKTTVDNASNSDSVHHNQAASLPMIRESIWEGAIQLTVSSLCNVVAIFKSGEKPSLKDWRSFIEIKGRVKLSAFQEFVDQLPKSKSRAIMVFLFLAVVCLCIPFITELCWKEGSSESGRQNILQTIDAYISDERVGLAEPAEGIELYLCPPHGKTVEILSRHLPKEHQESLAVAGSSFIGVVVWRRPSISRAPTSHHNNRHDGSKRQSILGKPQVTNPAARPSLPPNSYGAPPGFTSQREEEDVTDDAPPGFGPGVARDEDDLPEFNFVKSSHHAANVTAHAYKGPWPHVPPPSARPAEQMRELVQKYGKRSSVQEAPRAWDDDDDDIPEWNPTHQTIKQPPLPHAPQQLPLPPPPVQQMNAAYQQQYHIPSAVQPQVPITSLPHAYLRTQQPQPGQAWQQPSNAWWPAQGVAAPAAQQPQYGVVPGSSGVQGYDSSNAGGMAWRPR